MSPAASFLTNATSPRVIASTRFVHQQRTQNNTPMPNILEEEADAEATPPDDGVKNGMPASAAEQRRDDVTEPVQHDVADIQDMLQARTGAHLVEPAITKPVWRVKATCRRVNGVIIGSKCNNVKNASSKSLQKLIDEQTDRDRQSMLQEQVNKLVSQKLPKKKSDIYFHVPTPKGIICIPMENKNTIEINHRILPLMSFHG